MKEITQKEQKKLMLDMLMYIDGICRNNGINYSVIGGTLIGAIRHKGFIPWDDDIDIILTKENYDKLVGILSKKTGRYETLKDGRGGEKISFTKLIDKETVLKEGEAKINPNYGVFVDIFCYNYTPDDPIARKKFYKKTKLLTSLFGRRKVSLRKMSTKQAAMRLGKNIISRIMGYKRIKKCMKKLGNKYSDTGYMVSNWITYGFENETQSVEDLREYTDVVFEGKKVMAFKNYDNILRRTFGDYMTPPPEKDRNGKHSLRAYWRKDYLNSLNNK